MSVVYSIAQLSVSYARPGSVNAKSLLPMLTLNVPPFLATFPAVPVERLTPANADATRSSAPMAASTTGSTYFLRIGLLPLLVPWPVSWRFPPTGCPAAADGNNLAIETFVRE